MAHSNNGPFYVCDALSHNGFLTCLAVKHDYWDAVVSACEFLMSTKRRILVFDNSGERVWATD